MTVAKVRLGAHLVKRKEGSCAFISADKNQLWPESSPTTLVTFPILPLRGPFDVVCVYVLERHSVFPKTSSHGRTARIFTIINNLILESMAHTNILPCEEMEFFFYWKPPDNIKQHTCYLWVQQLEDTVSYDMNDF